MFRSAQKNIVKSTLIAAGVLAAGGIVAGTTHALTYQQDIGVSFTFNPSLQVTLSSADIIIPNLTPGTASDSNVITVNIKTNATNGYTLNATVGNDTTYNTRDLVHNNSTITNKFSSVDFGSSIATNTNLNDNTWAYNYSTDGGTTWNNYSGLPLYNDETNVATLKTTTGPVSSSDGDNVEFKIAAKASSDQVSGEYNNVINFTATAQVVPTTLEMAYADAGKEKLNGYYKLQDMNANICNAAEVLDEGSQMQAIDTRDNKVYWITKLRDGKCWFTQNLDHDIDSIKTYTSADTDLGYGTSTTTSWTPDKSTYPTGTTTWDISSTGYNIQQSYDPGNKIWDGTPDPNYSTTLDNMTQGTNTHYHIGNYYNWGAAVAMNDTSSYTTNNQDVDQSICPAGWTLPKDGDNTSIGSFQYLVSRYDWNSSSFTMKNPHMWEVPLYFSLGGYWGGRSSGFAGAGYFWSPVVDYLDAAYFLCGHYDDGDVSPGSASYRYWGYSVRCVSR